MAKLSAGDMIAIGAKYHCCHWQELDYVLQPCKTADTCFGKKEPYWAKASK